MGENKKTKTLTVADFAASYCDPALIKVLVEPSFTAWADWGENKPRTRAERARFAIRNKRDEWRERLALWIAPWLESDN